MYHIYEYNRRKARSKLPDVSECNNQSEYKEYCRMISTSQKSSPSKNNNRAANIMPVLTSAPPPWHSVVSLALATAVCIKYLPSAESLDEVATIETFPNIIFPELWWGLFASLSSTRDCLFPFGSPLSSWPPFRMAGRKKTFTCQAQS
jgi:hypothetical protein